MDYSNLNLDFNLKPLNSPVFKQYQTSYDFNTNTERASIDTSFLQDQSVTNAKIVNLTANKITAGTITSGVIFGGTINGTQVTAGTLGANVVYAGTISANRITAGSINASSINVYNLNADNITAGNIDASSISIENLDGVTDTNGSTVINGGYITTGTINASQVSVTNINANNINAGTLSGRTVQSTSGDSRVVMTNGDLIEFYEGGTRRSYIQGISSGAQMVGEFLASTLWVGSSTGSPAGVANFEGDVRVNGTLDMDTNKINEVTSVGESDSKRIQFDQTGRIQITDDFDPSSASNYNLGGNDRYWQEVHCKSVVDHSMGFYDEGFTDKKGNKISDTQAVLNIKPHPTRMMASGRPYLDKRTFPKEFMSKAYNKETDTFYKRDEEDRPFILEENGNKKYVDGYDGVELNQVVALLIGSVKELTNRTSDLERYKLQSLEIISSMTDRILKLEQNNSPIKEVPISKDTGGISNA